MHSPPFSRFLSSLKDIEAPIDPEELRRQQAREERRERRHREREQLGQYPYGQADDDGPDDMQVRYVCE